MPDTPLRLYFGPLLLGQIKNAVEREGTWFGVFEAARIKGPDIRDKRIRRIHQYIDFSADWNKRVADGEPAAATEWRVYADVTDSDQWHTVDAAGVKRGIQAPAFHPNREMSWEPPNDGDR
jgi:hypothetical protein